MRLTKIFADRKWLISGVMASIGYGLWGFLDKFSTTQRPTISNLLLYGIALSIGLVFAAKYRSKPSKNALIAGICSGIINIFVLYSLLSNKLVLVFPFVSFGTVFFTLIYLAYFHPSYTKKMKIYISAGIAISTLGLILISLGISGGIAQIVATYSFDLSTITLGIAISVFTGFWTFFTFLTVFRDKVHPLASAVWIYFGSFILAACALLIDLGPVLSEFSFSQDLVFPLIGGFFIFIGQIAASYGFRYVTSVGGVKQIVVAFLANGELLPILFLSYFVLHEFSNEGFIGAILVFAGLLVINKVRASEESIP